MINTFDHVPDGWIRVPLEKIADVIMGQSPDSQFVNEEEVGVPFLQGNADFTSKHPIPIHWVTRPRKLAKKNDVLISVRAPVGEINIADEEYCIGRGCF
jgi:type I restriction enzyme S subunit